MPLQGLLHLSTHNMRELISLALERLPGMPGLVARWEERTLSGS